MTEQLELKRPELTTDELLRQNNEAFKYLKSLTKEDESLVNLTKNISVRFRRGGTHRRGRLDKVLVIFLDSEKIPCREEYIVSNLGLHSDESGVFGDEESTDLQSGLRAHLRYEVYLDLQKSDVGMRTIPKVIADTVRAKIEAESLKD